MKRSPSQRTGLGPAGPLPDIGPFDRRVIAVGGIVFAVLMALSDRYGFDRDELYFLDCARHLQASYVDQPVLAPLLAWVSLKLFGVSLPGLRVWPALAGLAGVPARRPRPDLRQGEPEHAGDHRLAPARPYRRCGMDIPATR
jgi:hypothetical protein